MWNCTYTQVSVVFVGQHCSLSHFSFSALGLVALGAETEPAKIIKFLGYHMGITYMYIMSRTDDWWMIIELGVFFLLHKT